MLHMLKNKKINIAIVIVSIIVFLPSLYLMRNLATIEFLVCINFLMSLVYLKYVAIDYIKL